jgi:hypothetical protein
VALLGWLLEQRLLLGAFESFPEESTLARGDQGRPVDLTQVLVIFLSALVAKVAPALEVFCELLGLEILVVEVEFKVRDQWRMRMVVFLLFLDLSPRLEQPQVILMMIVARVLEDQGRLWQPSVKNLIIKVRPILPLGPVVVTLSLDILGMRIVRRRPS